MLTQAKPPERKRAAVPRMSNPEAAIGHTDSHVVRQHKRIVPMPYRSPCGIVDDDIARINPPGFIQRKRWPRPAPKEYRNGKRRFCVDDNRIASLADCGRTHAVRSWRGADYRYR